MSDPAPRSPLLLLFPLAALGCAVPTAGGSGPAIDDGCSSAVDPGDPSADEEAMRALWRLNCYRGAMGLPLVRLDAGLSAAARAHAEYIEATGDYGHRQSRPSDPWFSGADPADRAAAAGYALDERSHRITEVLAYESPAADGARAVDIWFDSVYHREPLATPAVAAVGFGSAGIYSVMEVVSPWEASDGSGAPWAGLYPPDELDGVPTSFDSDREWPDPAPDASVVGYPITATVIAGSWHGPSNPHALRLDAAQTRLLGPEGEVALTLLQPDDDAYLLRTVALLPVEPLTPGAEYEAQVVGSLGSASFRRFWTFRTGE